VTEQNPAKLGKTIKELDISNASVFEKTKFSMCIEEADKYLQNFPQINSIVLFGLEAHICVEQTTLDLLASEEYTVHVVADCTLSRSQEDRLLAFERMKNAGAIITTSENVIFKLMKDKNHPKFNEVRKLVTDPSSPTGLCNKL
jgi:nicotinamidase-related amidase